jgi:hypothetical protein
MAGFGPAHAAPLIDPKECLPHFKNGVTAGYGCLGAHCNDIEIGCAGTLIDANLFRGHLCLRGVECNSPTRHAKAFRARKLVR